MTLKKDRQCRHILENLSAYLDGGLDEARCNEIEAHIRTCRDCQIVINTLKETIHLCQVDGRDVRLPTEARRRLFARLALDNPDDPKNE